MSAISGETVPPLAGTSPPRLRLRTLPGVWRPHNDARLLARVVSGRRLADGADVLDMFTGSGVLAIGCARSGARSVTAVDVSRRALLSVRRNARRNGVRVRTRRGDLFAALRDERFDLILANPPYYPGPPSLPRGGAARAWEGGDDGRLLIDRFCRQAPAFLRPGGRLLIVHGSFNGERATCELLAARGLATEISARHRGPLGAVGRARAAALRRQGLQTVDGRDEEETIVICGLRKQP